VEDPFLFGRTGVVALPGRTMGGISEIEAVRKISALKQQQQGKQKPTRTGAFEGRSRSWRVLDGKRVFIVQGLPLREQIDVVLLDDAVALSVREDVEPVETIVGLVKVGGLSTEK
jgi:hypothetical protein